MCVGRRISADGENETIKAADPDSKEILRKIKVNFLDVWDIPSYKIPRKGRKAWIKE